MHRVLEHIDPAGSINRWTSRHWPDVAHFSPFFISIDCFSAWMGETLGDYLRRRRRDWRICGRTRLDRAKTPSVRVLPIALSVGFGSAEAFARAAFKNQVSAVRRPSWREQQSALRSAKSNPGQVNRNTDQGNHRQNLAKNDAVHPPITGGIY